MSIMQLVLIRVFFQFLNLDSNIGFRQEKKQKRDQTEAGGKVSWIGNKYEQSRRI